MGLFDNHFASKNAASARAWAMDDEKKKQAKRREAAEPKMGICDKCHKEALVRPFRSRQTDMGNGAASFGTVIKHLCEECAPKSRRQQDAEIPQMDKKQVKNLLKSAKKGLL